MFQLEFMRFTIQFCPIRRRKFLVLRLNFQWLFQVFPLRFFQRGTLDSITSIFSSNFLFTCAVEWNCPFSYTTESDAVFFFDFKRLASHLFILRLQFFDLAIMYSIKPRNDLALLYFSAKLRWNSLNSSNFIWNIIHIDLPPFLTSTAILAYRYPKF